MSIVTVADNLIGVQTRVVKALVDEGFSTEIFAKASTDIGATFEHILALDTSGTRMASGPIGEVANGARLAMQRFDEIAKGQSHGPHGAQEGLAALGTAISHLPFVR